MNNLAKAVLSNLLFSNLFAIFLLLSLACFSSGAIYAQSEVIPEVKVAKKKKRPERPLPRKKPIRIKDRYRRPASTSRPEKAVDNYKRPQSMKTSQGGVDNYQPPKTIQKRGKIVDQYRQPPSQRVRYNNQPDNDNQLRPPQVEEGGTVERLSIWQRIFNRKKATIYAGSQKFESPTPSVGTLHGGKIKYKPTDHEEISKNQHQHQGNIQRVPPKLAEKQYQYKALHMSSYQGEIQYKPTNHKKISKNQHQHQGNIRRAPPKLVEKQHIHKALYMSLYQGEMKVLKPDRQEKQHWAQASELQQAGMYKIKKEKNEAPDYTTFYKQMKVLKPEARTRNFEKLSSKVHQYEGDIRIRKPEEDMHPSVYYLKSKTKNSYEEKEKYRKWRLMITHIFDKNSQPKHTKEKPRKPRYDKDESEIWYY